MDPQDGSFAITGRSRDLIITGGLNVSPAEVEDALSEHPTVRSAAVAGVPSERWGEQVTAFVVANGPESLRAEELIEHCRTRLSAYKCPKRVIAVERIPTNEMGKVLRDRLLALADETETTQSETED